MRHTSCQLLFEPHGSALLDSHLVAPKSLALRAHMDPVPTWAQRNAALTERSRTQEAASGPRAQGGHSGASRALGPVGCSFVISSHLSLAWGSLGAPCRAEVATARAVTKARPTPCARAAGQYGRAKHAGCACAAVACHRMPGTCGCHARKFGEMGTPSWHCFPLDPAGSDTGLARASRGVSPNAGLARFVSASREAQP